MKTKPASLSENERKEILSSYRRVAVVGLSADESRDSNRVAKFLQDNGFDIIPVNPSYREILGKKCYPRLVDVDGNVEIVDIFRKSEAVGEIVEEAIRIGAKVVWMQEGVINEDAARRAREAGLKVVMDRCIKKEYAELFPSGL
ncbi:MAG: CoA-binding protein [Acidobacteriota bacterium]